MFNKIKIWWYRKTPTAGNKGFLGNLIYKLAWRFGVVVSPSFGSYKQYKEYQRQIKGEE